MPTIADTFDEFVGKEVQTLKTKPEDSYEVTLVKLGAIIAWKQARKVVRELTTEPGPCPFKDCICEDVSRPCDKCEIFTEAKV